eukprot:7764518-Pyramimonas_sp.AAC.1
MHRVVEDGLEVALLPQTHDLLAVARGGLEVEDVGEDERRASVRPGSESHHFEILLRGVVCLQHAQEASLLLSKSFTP